MPPRVQLLLPETTGGGTAASAAEVQREGTTPVRRARIADERRQDGVVRVRTLARHDAAGEGAGAETYSPMTIEHVELEGVDASYSLPLPDGWTCLVYVRRGTIELGGGSGKPTTANMFDTVYLDRRGGDGLALSNAGSGSADVLVLAGEPIGAPVVASGTMVMNSQEQVSQALYDYQRGDFGVPWPHEMTDEEWATQCDARSATRGGLG